MNRGVYAAGRDSENWQQECRIIGYRHKWPQNVAFLAVVREPPFAAGRDAKAMMTIVCHALVVNGEMMSAYAQAREGT